MKVLILGSKEYPVGTSDDPIKSGGMEIYTQNFTKHMKERVEKIIIITRRFSNTSSYEKKGNIEVYRVRWFKGLYLRNPSFNINAFFKALSLDYDIIMSQGLVSSFFGCLLSFIKKKKLVARPAGVAYVQPQYGSLLKKVLLFFEKIAYKNADVVVFLSEAEKEQFKKKLGFLPRRFEIIPTGVEIPDGDVKRLNEEFSSGEGTTITTVGRLIGVKGIDIFIHALEGIEGKFRALIVGDGQERKRLEALVKEYHLENKVIFSGWRDDIPAILAASDIFVLSSYSEGLPIALLEAMASGKPCIVTDIGLPVENRKDALVVRAGDAKELKKAVEELLENKKLREKLGKEAKKKAIAKFSWKNTIEGYMKVFGSILE
ncbi:GDP-mannose-dependent alpha-(1-6)-phosphatidylinositol monomannoside mannosyltransferase [archaeon]|nr:GDP-mannose-dependent alpha-(1-6)-phosphatidylinositol monomannoside mannosyltransferase [archaeon]